MWQYNWFCFEKKSEKEKVSSIAFNGQAAESQENFAG
jgi:hypothetical protein